MTFWGRMYIHDKTKSTKYEIFEKTEIFQKTEKTRRHIWKNGDLRVYTEHWHVCFIHMSDRFDISVDLELLSKSNHTYKVTHRSNIFHSQILTIYTQRFRRSLQTYRPTHQHKRAKGIDDICIHICIYAYENM